MYDKPRYKKVSFSLLETHKKSREERKLFFINKSVEVHGNKYDYSKVIYTRAKDKVIILCSVHGDFLQSSDKHTQGKGCIKCGIAKNKQTYFIKWSSEFIKKANEIHGYKYDYSKIVLKTSRCKVEIICPIHGIFKQVANNHTRGHGCSKCGDDNIRSNLWSYSYWGEKALKSSKFDAFKVYIIKCWDITSSETFYKIGRTFTSIELRFSGVARLPYEYSIIKIIKDEDPYKICILEKKLQDLCGRNKYIPKRLFKGNTECFLDIINIKQEIS